MISNLELTADAFCVLARGYVWKENPMPHISPQLFQFFRDLKTNNNRDWFQTNKKRYEGEVKGPLLQLIGAVAHGTLAQNIDEDL